MPAKKHIATITVGAGGAASIEFAGIPQTGTDLVLEVSGRNATSQHKLWMQVNASAAGYTYRSLVGSGSTVYSGANGDGNDRFAPQGYTVPAGASNFSSIQIFIPNYAGASAKSVSFNGVSEANSSEAYQDATAGLWNSSAAVTSVKLFTSYPWAQYSTASLYMFTKGSGGASVA